MSSTVPSPSSSTRYSFFPIPTPCSPVPDAPKTVNTKHPGDARERGHTRPVHGNCAVDESVDSVANELEFSVITEKDKSVEVAWYQIDVNVWVSLRSWGRTISDVSDDSRLKPRPGKVLFRLVYQLRELGYRNATSYHQPLVS